MNQRGLSDFERFERSSPERRRRLYREQFVLAVTEELVRVMHVRKRMFGIRALASQSGRTVHEINRILMGQDISLHTLSDLCDALRVKPIIRLVNRK